eukprot:SAG31_NODE_15943_length_730_cov_1.383518_1_plen_168_part_10
MVLCVVFVYFYSWAGDGLLWALVDCVLYSYAANCSVHKALPMLNEKFDNAPQRMIDDPVPTALIGSAAFAVWYCSDWWIIRSLVGLVLAFLFVATLFQAELIQSQLRKDPVEAKAAAQAADAAAKAAADAATAAHKSALSFGADASEAKTKADEVADQKKADAEKAKA